MSTQLLSTFLCKIYLEYHFHSQIDETTLKRVGFVIGCHRFRGTHDFSRIAEILDEMNKTLEIDNEVVSTTTDNGSNFVKCFEEFGCSSGKSIVLNYHTYFFFLFF